MKWKIALALLAMSLNLCAVKSHIYQSIKDYNKTLKALRQIYTQIQISALTEKNHTRKLIAQNLNIRLEKAIKEPRSWQSFYTVYLRTKYQKCFCDSILPRKNSKSSIIATLKKSNRPKKADLQIYHKGTPLPDPNPNFKQQFKKICAMYMKNDKKKSPTGKVRPYNKSS